MSETDAPKKLSKNEEIKANSNNLRGSIAEELDDLATGGITADTGQLTKFHGMYIQDDRDVRKERRSKKLDKAYAFMLRVRLPAGVATPQQYATLDQLATDFANGTLRVTTRQTFQLHGLLKFNVRRTVRRMDEVLLDSIGACGDINRNVMCHPNLSGDAAREELFEVARSLSKHFMPHGKAYHELFIDGEKVSSEPEEEPIYGKTYLPRKFKIGLAVPPRNDVDVFSQDLGFIAIYKGKKLLGYNVSVGGGMGMTHGNANTYPMVGQLLGFCEPDQIIPVAEAVVTAQRDHGNRSDRKRARLKYTIEDRGLDWFRDEVESRSGVQLGKPRAFEFKEIADEYGWHKDVNGKWFYVQFVLSGRIKDEADCRLKTALRKVADLNVGDFRMTPSQNVAICGLDDAQKKQVEEILESHGVAGPEGLTGLRRNALSCVALPTCGLALSESERALPGFLDDLEKVIDEAGLRDEEISLRMTGCPNGCARPYLAEIGLVGKAPGKFNLYLGADYLGLRLNAAYKEGITLDNALETLAPLLKAYAKERNEGERFGDYCLRKGLVEIPDRGVVSVEIGA